MDIIEFGKNNYRIRQIEIENLGLMKIASTELNDVLLCRNGSYKSDEAIFIDEQIYFFVEPTKFKLNDGDLIKYVNKYCV